MKKLISFALALTLCLALFGCSDEQANLPKPNVTGDTTVLGSDFQKDTNQSTADHIGEICESDTGYFFCYADGNIYYLDKESGASTVLCGKPECCHKDENCNASISARSLNYYDGKLYWTHHDYVQENGSVVDKGTRLHSMDLDGTNHKVIQNLEFTPGGNTSNYITEPIIHRGIVYFNYSRKLYMTALGTDVENAVCIFGEEIIDDGSNIISSNELYYELWADGDLMYFMAKNIKQSNGTYKDTLYSYDPQNEKLTKLWQVPDKSDVGTWDTTGVSVSSWYIFGDYIYFYLCGNDLWYSELSTGKTAKLADVDLDAGATIFSAEHIAVLNKEIWGQSFSGGSALTGGDTLYIYNYSGELIKKISLEKIYSDSVNVDDCSLLWIGDGQVYILADATVQVINSTHTALVYRMYSVDIETGEVTKASWSVGE